MLNILLKIVYSNREKSPISIVIEETFEKLILCRLLQQFFSQIEIHHF